MATTHVRLILGISQRGAARPPAGAGSRVIRTECVAGAALALHLLSRLIRRGNVVVDGGLKLVGGAAVRVRDDAAMGLRVVSFEGLFDRVGGLAFAFEIVRVVFLWAISMLLLIVTAQRGA